MLGLIKTDGTADCEECGLPLFPHGREGDTIVLECANRHGAELPAPTDPATLRAVNVWIAKRGAQLHVQHERWGTDDLVKGRDTRDI
ncbi:MAG: hypothetical protein HY216_14305 [Candidatus Rokubacteria bacterium]|nr:hypothetical protein [Candidatus Rokubacteria bacterium]